MLHAPISVYYSEICRLQPGQAEGPLVREAYQLHYVTEGAATVKTDGTTFCVRAGQCFLAHPLDIVACENPGSDSWECYRLTFGGDLAATIAKEIGLKTVQCVVADDDEGSIKKALLSLWEVLPELQGQKYEVISRFYALIARFRLTETKNYVEKARNYIENNYPFPIRIEQIARYVGLDRTYLFKLFVKQAGVSPQEYLIRYRLEQAMHFLKTCPSLSAAQVAASCGFGDAPSFCKHFKARFGCTPTEFRNGKHN